jgi:large subunit ribosomal protein L32e
MACILLVKEDENMTKGSVIKEFTSLNGVGNAKAELLYASGFDSIDKLKKSTVEDLKNIKGITEKNAKDILSQLKETGKKEPTVTKPKTQVKPKKEIKKEKPAPAEEKPEGKTTKEKEESVEIVEDEEEEGYKAKKKPKLSKEQKEKLQVRRQIKKRTPTFLREEWFRYKRIPRNWRRPDGITSKMRINLKYRPSKVRVGFRGPRGVRGLHPSGFEEVMIYNVNDLKGIDPEKQAARIGGTVGTKKRLEIAKKAEELEIRILNMRV